MYLYYSATRLLTFTCRRGDCSAYLGEMSDMLYRHFHHCLVVVRSSPGTSCWYLRLVRPGCIRKYFQRCIWRQREASGSERCQVPSTLRPVIVGQRPRTDMIRYEERLVQFGDN